MRSATGTVLDERRRESRHLRAGRLVQVGILTAADLDPVRECFDLLAGAGTWTAGGRWRLTAWLRKRCSGECVSLARHTRTGDCR